MNESHTHTHTEMETFFISYQHHHHHHCYIMMMNDDDDLNQHTVKSTERIKRYKSFSNPAAAEVENEMRVKKIE